MPSECGHCGSISVAPGTAIPNMYSCIKCGAHYYKGNWYYDDVDSLVDLYMNEKETSDGIRQH